ncbi:protein of unknown function [Nitrospira defluvii]|uniref:Uncharacterized protein n=1 Tax=Nitrospira defluvii TaxID=330214 RepID=D8PI03_9BACT|nr:protein of unknown function [Nitrospira defluvii]
MRARDFVEGAGIGRRTFFEGEAGNLCGGLVCRCKPVTAYSERGLNYQQNPQALDSLRWR